MGIIARIGRDDISPRLRKMAGTARDKVKVLRAMGTTFKSITEGTFSSLGADYRPTPWAPKKGGQPSILQKSTTMAKAFQLHVTSASAKVSNPMVYASIHQFGGTIYPRYGGKLRFKWGPGANDWATVDKVKVPPRPFFPVQNGKMTAKAEARIAKAGERVIAGEKLKS